MIDTWHKSVKAAQRELIGDAGGIERAARISCYSTSVVGRWNAANSPDIMPLDAVRMLENDTGKYLITEIMAHEGGRKLLEPAGPVSDAGALDAMIRDLLVNIAELAARGTVVTSDNHISPSETATLDTPIARIMDTGRKLQQLSAAVKANGGASADLKLVRE